MRALKSATSTSTAPLPAPLWLVSPSADSSSPASAQKLADPTTFFSSSILALSLKTFSDKALRLLRESIEEQELYITLLIRLLALVESLHQVGQPRYPSYPKRVKSPLCYPLLPSLAGQA